MRTDLFARQTMIAKPSRQSLLGRALIALSLLLMAWPGHAATKTDGGQAGNKNVSEKKIVAKTVDTVTMAWNKNEPDVIAGLFLPDAVLVMPTGSVVKSRAAIRKRLIDERNGKLKDTTLENRIAAIFFPNSQAAIVRGEYQLHGMKILGFETSPAGKFVFHQRKHQGRWMIAKAEILRQS